MYIATVVTAARWNAQEAETEATSRRCYICACVCVCVMIVRISRRLLLLLMQASEMERSVMRSCATY